MADLLPPLELELRVALLPPISRGAHLDGPLLYAQRLVALWKVDDGDHVPLAQAFRLLDEQTVAGGVWRARATKEPYDHTKEGAGQNDGGATVDLAAALIAEATRPDRAHASAGSSQDIRRQHTQRYWTFPPISDLLSELQEASWQAMTDGVLLAEETKEGKWHAIPLAALPRLRGLSQLTLGEIRVRRAPAFASGALVAQEAPDSAAFSLLSQDTIKKAWRKHPSQEQVDARMDEVAKEYPPAEDYLPNTPRPAFKVIWAKLKRVGDVTRRQAKAALTTRAPHLQGHRGYRSAKSPT